MNNKFGSFDQRTSISHTQNASEKKANAKEMDQSFPSTSSYIESMQEYTMTQVCIVFRFIFNDFLLHFWLGWKRATNRSTDQPSKSEQAGQKKRNRSAITTAEIYAAQSQCSFCEHCRLNYNLPVVGICVLELKLCARCSAIRCMLCTNTPVFGNSTITN